jgi:hypothetical protein
MPSVQPHGARYNRCVVKWLAVAVALGLGATACTSTDRQGSPTVPTEIPSVAGRGPKDPFGVLIASPNLDVDQQVAIAKELNVRYVRPAYPIFALSQDLRCVGCQEFEAAGFDLVLTVRNSEDASAQIASGQPFPSSPPQDLDTYRDTIATIVDRYQPALLVVENEEDVLTHYSGTPEEYADQLQVACQAAHEGGTKCTNGGLLSGSVVYLVYQAYVDGGMTAEAQSFADRAFEDFQRARLASPEGQERLRFVIDRLRRFVSSYRESGADYVNFHWYVGDATAMREAAQYLSEASGLAPVTNEMGQRDLSPDTTLQLMSEVRRLGLPYAVWYLADAKLARGLIEPNGTLRPTGEAFREFIQANS